MKTGLVLGAGGASGWVYHAAVLDAARDSGFEANEAEVIVGTSAGASMAAAIRAGIAPERFTRTVTRPPTADERRAMMGELRAARKSSPTAGSGADQRVGSPWSRLVGSSGRAAPQGPVPDRLGRITTPGWRRQDFPAWSLGACCEIADGRGGRVWT